MSFEELKTLIAADQYRFEGKRGLKNFASLWLRESGFRFTVVMRTCAFLRSQKFSRYGLYHLFLFWHRRQQVKYSTYIDFSTKIGGGLYVGHPCAVIVNVHSVIGRDCTLSQSVTLGNTNRRSKYPGCPTIGDRVYLGPGAVIVGGVTIGDDCVVGPNSVVAKSFPSGSVISGLPAQLLSSRGSEGYVTHLTSAPERNGPPAAES